MRKSEAQGVESGTYPENRNKIWRRTKGVHFICYDKHAEGPSTKHRPGRNVLCLGRCFMQHHKRTFCLGRIYGRGFLDSTKKQRIRSDRHRVSTLRDMIGRAIKVLQRGGTYRAGPPKPWRCQRVCPARRP